MKSATVDQKTGSGMNRPWSPSFGDSSPWTPPAILMNRSSWPNLMLTEFAFSEKSHFNRISAKSADRELNEGPNR